MIMRVIPDAFPRIRRNAPLCAYSATGIWCGEGLCRQEDLTFQKQLDFL